MRAWFQWARDTSDSLALQPYSRLAQCQSSSRLSASDMLCTIAAAASLSRPSSSSDLLDGGRGAPGGCTVPFGVAAQTQGRALLDADPERPLLRVLPIPPHTVQPAALKQKFLSKAKACKSDAVRTVKCLSPSTFRLLCRALLVCTIFLCDVCRLQSICCQLCIFRC